MIRNKKILIVLFVGLIISQIYIPASMIIKREIILTQGIQYKFRAAPVDPYDPFRGRYVYINIDNANEIKIPENETYLRNETVYAIFEKGADGFSRIGSIARIKPESDNYFKTRVLYNSGNRDGSTYVAIDIPFNRYFMDESIAPEAERAYRENVRGIEGDAYVTVRLKGGEAVLERLYIKDMPVEQYIREGAKK
jgi:uncharacterized membrane-anchored protein